MIFESLEKAAQFYEEAADIALKQGNGKMSARLFDLALSVTE